jgi:rod shape-determining protein MreC
VVGLVVVSLALLTVSFRSTTLDPVEGFGASVLRPFEVAANRVAHPFRDAVDWVNGLSNARAENRALVAANARLRRQNAQLKGAEEENAIFRKDLHFVRSPTFPKDYDYVGARVITSPSALSATVTIDAGTNQGIRLEDVVVTSDGLVGTISKVFGNEAQVTLITDPTSAVTATDATNLAAIGVLDHGTGSDSLILDRIGKDKAVNYGDMIITAGSQSGSKLPSIFPRGIPIGTVTSVNQTDTDIFKDIEVSPFVDLSSLESVLVLIPKPAGTSATPKQRR